MAIFNRLTEEQIKQDYDHYGLFMGIVPIYVGDHEGEFRVAVRNWWPDWLLDLADAISRLTPYDYWSIKLTGQIK
ncbi:hypothetical protein LH673_02460 [Morganella morganii]|uniref:hypothetical protein n=1 Tax=Morganella morganii TaxID=582 RepID=UPI001F36C547|nr:hypothetical protein [Morganella morganii]MCF1264259.1 hypothetical protein [Morganella morganii]